MNVRFSFRFVSSRVVALAGLTSALFFVSGSVTAAGNAAHADLLRAVQTGDTASWQMLLKAKADVAVRDAAGNTSLHLAALNQDLTALTALLAAGAEADARNQAGATPLLYGAGHVGIVRALLARGANPNAVSKAKNRDCSAWRSLRATPASGISMSTTRTRTRATS